MLAGAAATAALSIPRVAHGKGTTGNDFIQDLSGVVSGYEKNEEGDAKIYTPKARVDGAGSKSSLLLVYSPTPGPISNEDFVDALWLKDERGLVLASEQFRSNGKSYSDPGEAGTTKSIEPKFTARVDAGTGKVYPFMHTHKGFVWEGKPVVVK